MDKKKLTKAQVKKAFRDCDIKLGRLVIDKATAENSNVPMSLMKLIEIKAKLQLAEKRIK